MPSGKVLQKFDRTAIIVVNGYSRAVVLNEWKRHIESIRGKVKFQKGWVTGADLREMLKDGTISNEEEVYLVVFGNAAIDGYIEAREKKEASTVAEALESKPRSDLLG